MDQQAQGYKLSRKNFFFPLQREINQLSPFFFSERRISFLPGSNPHLAQTYGLVSVLLVAIKIHGHLLPALANTLRAALAFEEVFHSILIFPCELKIYSSFINVEFMLIKVTINPEAYCLRSFPALFLFTFHVQDPFSFFPNGYSPLNGANFLLNSVSGRMFLSWGCKCTCVPGK